MTSKAMRALSPADRTQLTADVVVIGLGAGGSMVFHDLVRAGFDVIGLELGRHFSTTEFNAREDLDDAAVVRRRRRTRDRRLQRQRASGQGVGGSTRTTPTCANDFPDSLPKIGARVLAWM
ncbi:MAG: hypothetical protein R3E66_18605 [bacterium]